jgi:hypothetical protein
MYNEAQGGVNKGGTINLCPDGILKEFRGSSWTGASAARPGTCLDLNKDRRRPHGAPLPFISLSFTLSIPSVPLLNMPSVHHRIQRLHRDSHPFEHRARTKGSRGSRDGKSNTGTKRTTYHTSFLLALR